MLDESDTDEVFESVYMTVLSNIQKSFGKDWSWIIFSVVDNTNNISKYNTLSGSRYVKLPKELDHPNKFD